MSEETDNVCAVVNRLRSCCPRKVLFSSAFSAVSASPYLEFRIPSCSACWNSSRSSARSCSRPLRRGFSRFPRWRSPQSRLAIGSNGGGTMTSERKPVLSPVRGASQVSAPTRRKVRTAHQGHRHEPGLPQNLPAFIVLSPQNIAVRAFAGERRVGRLRRRRLVSRRTGTESARPGSWPQGGF
jgi:hypothetical protein